MTYRKLPRVYVIEKLLDNITISITDDIYHHLVNVLRIKQGDNFRIFNDSNGEFLAKLLPRKKAALIKKIRSNIVLPLLYIAPCIIKSKSMSLIIQMATQMGVTHIQPLISDYSVVRDFNHSRWQKSAIAASEQSERTSIPVIFEPIALIDLLNNKQIDLFIWGKVPDDNIKCNNDIISYSRLASKISNIKETSIIAIIVGPEGGFSIEEEKHLELHKKSLPITLGSTILKCETSIIAMISHIQSLKLLSINKRK